MKDYGYFSRNKCFSSIQPVGKQRQIQRYQQNEDALQTIFVFDGNNLWETTWKSLLAFHILQL